MKPRRRAQIPGWETDARRAVAGFRLDATRAADRADFDALVTEKAHGVRHLPEALLEGARAVQYARGR